MFLRQYGKQSITQNDIKAVSDVLHSDWLTQGPKVQEFEERLAKFCGVSFAVSVCNGTAALHLAYLAAGLKPGDEVIVPAMTFVATTNMLLALGATPVFCDIRPDTYNLDESKIEQCISKRTKAIVPVHFAGHPCAMDAIKRIARKRKLFIIADGAHALGAKYASHILPLKRGREATGVQWTPRRDVRGGVDMLNVAKFADMTTFSFHPVKPITTGEGGAIVTNSRKLYERMKLLRTHGVTKDVNGFITMSEMGFNYRITDLQCALGLSQLKRLHEFERKRRLVVSWYQESLSHLREIVLPVESSQVKSSWHLYVIRLKNRKHRLQLYRYLLKKGVGVNFHYPAVYRHPYYRTHGYAKISLPMAELYSDTAITLPLHVYLGQKDIRFIASAIANYFSQ